MGEGIADQIGQYHAQRRFRRAERCIVGQRHLHLHRPRAKQRCLFNDDPLQQWHQTHLRGGGRLVLAGQGQQCRHSLLQLQRGQADMLQVLLPALGQPGFVQQLAGRAGNHRQRCAQFVAGIAGEGVFAGNKGGHPGGQPVHGTRQHTDLVIVEVSSQGGVFPWQQWQRLNVRHERVQRARATARKPHAQQDRQQHHHQRGAGQQGHYVIADRAHRQLRADLGDQPGRP
ncbi:hypothetical protein D3C73_790600 [compost metagenome]